MEYDDLVGYGVFGLIDAIEKFDIEKKVKFETYASLRIRGAIIDSIRDLDWAPRSLRKKGKELERAYFEVENRLGHSASDQEIADHLGITTDELHKLLQEVNMSQMISLEDYLDQNHEIGLDGLTMDRDTTRPEQRIEIVELRETLAEAIEKLPEKERMVVTLYYFEELTLKEISHIMKVSESRISQLHKSHHAYAERLERLKSAILE